MIVFIERLCLCIVVHLLYFFIVSLYGCYLGQVSLVKEILSLNETSWLNKGVTSGAGPRVVGTEQGWWSKL